MALSSESNAQNLYSLLKCTFLRYAQRYAQNRKKSEKYEEKGNDEEIKIRTQKVRKTLVK
jgi:hypothetical protein